MNIRLRHPSLALFAILHLTFYYQVMIPEYIYKVAKVLEENGFETYLVGGSLRNLLMGRPAKDYDLTTDALPEQIEKLFPKSVMTNAKFGTVVVLTKNDWGELETVEVTTFRLEKDYVGGRWPSHVEFTSKLEEDLKRRDFTINALALRLITNDELYPTGHSHPATGKRITNADELKASSKLVDLFGGVKDLENKIIRAVGNPIERFTEDGLRTLRACRLASVYGLEIEENTFDAISKTLDIAKQISKERVRDELMQLVLKSPKPSIGIELMRKCGLLKLYIPELLETFDIKHKEGGDHGDQNVYDHILATVDIAPPEVRFAALFHDIAKPQTKDGDHFPDHDIVGAEMTKEIMTRLKFPRKDIEDTVNLVRWHMFYVPTGKITNDELRITNGGKELRIEDKELRNKVFEEGWGDPAVRRLIMKVGGHDQIDKLIKLRIADATSNPSSSFKPERIDALANRVADVRAKESLLSLKDLAISGKDLAELGIKPGPEMKVILEDLLEKVIEDISLNTKEKLVDLVKELKS
jgi:poly(A) polymerase/tRNA nucleotidyltransferase (CCA-adding enzyme)